MPSMSEPPFSAAPATCGGAALSDDLTQLLLSWSAGDTTARDRLMSLVYGDLRRIAQRRFAHEDCGHTLQATAVVHEAYLRLVDQKRVRWQNRSQFFAVAAMVMRRVLVSHSRSRQRLKRGGGAVLLSLDEAYGVGDMRAPDLVALDDALQVLEKLSPRQSRIVTLRFFGGLSIRETAVALGISPATVKLDWNLAKAWLFRELKGQRTVA